MEIIENGLNAEIFTMLRNTGPFKTYNAQDITEALKHTLYSIVIYDDEIPVAIGRIVGDNRIAFFIKDVVVLPQYRKQGYGDIVMRYLLKYISKQACENAYIGLMSTPNKECFYKKFGFIERPNKEHGAGMVMYYKGGS